ncbi:tRNA 2-thiouridine(34) synthase MnmA [Candidatus Peregrinibacteria bacterium]|nr:tRNA 2-thiouridine(34) synthase MnmA [Candidatus Peregrinibacteria bacterium]MBT3598456.1 tRNA 2-thiouridine(34) synthase MnmA [Candidatus Peregrinibacteria bacterium]MBT4367117.1 tRNA 2-thiouridine(34) synthase MnmA [Candidatus Peregrinibacteria bacterium]MBT4585469.1 tRNA 2-thiouridine(34) synthase MnmA [Candidatus Peregrinibacteria bacterium]MBT6730875.1 tRNA 2-thiouridine(34) synthase MnmA [Candidatus Peregrinibacteria bacterium]
MKILVAMSGGVDSSTVAHLLHKQGHELIGVMMKLWKDSPSNSSANTCYSPEQAESAKLICDNLNIPFHLITIEEEFIKHVVKPFLKSYETGSTPNPCIECNRYIKFGALFKKAKELGCDKMATGHYVQVSENKDGIFHLLKGKDPKKDQSYYLYTLTQEILSSLLFPLGGKTKKEVFSIAKTLKLAIPETYKESQDICFYSEDGPDEFLKRNLTGIKSGDICTEDGEIIGEHKGLPFYTIGQRKGLGIGGLKIPLYVKRKDIIDNKIIVADSKDDFSSSLFIQNLKWINPDYILDTKKVSARIHSLGECKSGTLEFDNKYPKFTFDQPIRGIADGQSIVFYLEDEVLGGGIILRTDSI